MSQRTYATGLIASDDPPTPEQVAAAAAEAARQAKADAIIQNARDIIAEVKAGQLTNARQDAAIKQLARAVLFLARGEVNNE